MSFKVIRYPDREALNSAAADQIVRVAQQYRDEPSGIMLSGGSTPLAIFDRIARQQPPPAADCTWLLYTDDRLVPASSPDSNYGNSRPLIKALDIPPARILRVNGALPLEAAAGDYERQLREFFNADGQVSLGLLGLGADGHTCSIFTDEAARERRRLAIPVAGRAGFDRVSVSPAILARTSSLIFLVAGQEKAQILRQLLANPTTTPAGIAVADHTNVQVWTDLPA